jgi:endonuclease/exonuclease/phosphatase family metal-dependent hydrolase
MALTLVSWNLKGSKGVDTGAVVDHIQAAGADVVVLQEVQRRQARAIARALRAASNRWAFKHWPIRTWPEGMAVIGVTRPAPAHARAITQRWVPWSSRRRILQVATVRLDTEADSAVVDVADAAASATSAGPAAGTVITLINVHLSSGDAAAIRAVEAGAVVRLVAERDRPAVVAGDFNDQPGANAHARFREAGLRDVWATLRGDDAGPTNWRGWVAATPGPPSQRLDYVLVSKGLEPLAVSVPRHGDPDFAPFAAISDHLPLTATVAAEATRTGS